MQTKYSTLYDLYEHCPISSFRVINYDGKSNLCYDELHSRVSRIAAALVAASASKSVIGCLVSQGLNLPSIILGILKASSAFVFLEVHKPSSALQNLQKYIPIRTLLIEDIFLKDFENALCSCWKKSPTAIYVGSTIYIIQSTKCDNEMCLNSKWDADLLKWNADLAYVIQTSGTTGEPKVVQVPNQCIVPNIIDIKSKFDVRPDDVILQCSPLSFDPSIIEIFLAFASGSALVIVPDKVRSIPKKIIKVIVDSKVTVLQTTPSLFESFGNQFIKDFLLKKDSCLRVLAFGGEICPSWSKLRRWRSDENETQIYNLYGITEISCWSSYFKIDVENNAFASSIPLGDPLLDTELEIRSSCAENISEGELYIGGTKRWCVVNDEIWPAVGTRIMRPSGDMVFRSTDGLMHFDGRKDSIIKYKGHKISLNSVNTIIGGCPDITSHFLHFEHTIFKLYLFLVWNKLTKSSIEERRHQLLKKLRESVSNLPVTEVISVPYIPLTVHGKSDCIKLFNFVNTKWSKMNVPKQISNESCIELVSTLWKDYTNQQHINGTDNFVEKGGDSMSALQFVAEVEWKLQMTIPMLIDKILNDTYKDVIDLVKSSLVEKKDSCKNRNNLISFESDTAEEPPYKKKHSIEFKCYEMASRRGYKVMCTDGSHLKEISNKKENDLSLQKSLYFELKYKFDLKKCIDASPCIAHFFKSDQLLAFIGSHFGVIMCINLRNGVVEWNTYLPDRIESSACLSSCGNYVLVGCYDHHLYCLDVRDGNVHWKYRAMAEIKSSPIVSRNNTVYVGSHDKHLYAIEVEQGNLAWKKKLASGSVFSSPAISEELSIVYAATLDGVFTALKMDSGVTMWMYDYGKPLFSTPLITAQSIFIGCTDGYMLKFDFDGNMVSKYHTDGPIFASAGSIAPESKKIVFGSHDSNVYCISHSCECLWKVGCDSPIYATPFTFQWMQESYVAIASTKGTLYILKQCDGQVIYMWNCPGEVFSSPVVLNDFLMFGCRDNYIYCFTLSAII